MTEPLTPQREAEQPICSQEAARSAGLDVAPTVTELAACAESIVHAWGDRSAEPDDTVASVADAGAQLARALPLLLAELDRTRALLAEHVEGLNDLAALVGQWHKRAVTAEAERDALKPNTERAVIKAAVANALDGHRDEADLVTRITDEVVSNLTEARGGDR